MHSQPRETDGTSPIRHRRRDCGSTKARNDVEATVDRAVALVYSINARDHGGTRVDMVEAGKAVFRDLERSNDRALLPASRYSITSPAACTAARCISQPHG
jgi:hypothetical protein